MPADVPLTFATEVDDHGRAHVYPLAGRHVVGVGVEPCPCGPRHYLLCPICGGDEAGCVGCRDGLVGCEPDAAMIVVHRLWP